MSNPPQPPPESGEPGEDWHALLRARGYRLTPQREWVLRAVERLGHATPEELLIEVRREADGVNLSTVYRTLELLEELKLVRHTHLTERSPTYHSARRAAHAHLVCRLCQRTTAMPLAELSAFGAQVQADHGFTPDLGHLAIFGVCQECS